MVSSRICKRLCLIIVLLPALVLTMLYARSPPATPATRGRYVSVVTPKKALVEEQIVDAVVGEDAGPSCTVDTNCNKSDGDIKREEELDISKGMWDRSHVFKVHPFVVSSSRWANMTSWNVCLSTQCSVDMLFWVAEQMKTWMGPMSVSVFTPDVDYTIAMIMIRYMRTCFPGVRDRVSFHLIYPHVMPPKLLQTEILEFDCERSEAVNMESVKLIRTKDLIRTISIARYPQNLMRNTARQGCQADYCYTPDIDMLTIPSFSEEVNDFIGKTEVQNCIKCAYVLPTYEIAHSAKKYPESKEELKGYLKRKLAQRFHIKVYAHNQANSNLSLWESYKSETSLGVAYNVTSWKGHWEPIYITKSPVPSFDERFIGYGFTRNSQVYEMRLAGYTWHVFNNAFLVHRGFQKKASHKRVRRRQIAENNGRFNTFVRELHLRYNVPMEEETSKKRKTYKKRNRKESEDNKKNVT